MALVPLAPGAPVETNAHKDNPSFKPIQRAHNNQWVMPPEMDRSCRCSYLEIREFHWSRSFQGCRGVPARQGLPKSHSRQETLKAQETQACLGLLCQVHLQEEYTIRGRNKT